MPYLGAHLSVAGGFHKAVESATKLGMQTVQIFTHAPAQWAVQKAKPQKGAASPSWVGKELSPEQIANFDTAIRQAKLHFPTAHDSYLINLAAPADELFDKSVEAFIAELERAEKLKLAYLVTHPGAHVGSGEEAALQRVIQGLNIAMDRTPGYQVKVLLENTAGQGTTLGWKFEHLASLINGVEQPDRFGVCFDTCHAFAAGYDLRTSKGLADVLQQFDSLIGLDRLKLFHLNDSVKGLGSRVDRHAGLGLGMIGEEAFRGIVTDPRFASLPMVLETPKEGDNGEEMDPINLGILKRFLGEEC